MQHCYRTTSNNWKLGGHCNRATTTAAVPKRLTKKQVTGTAILRKRCHHAVPGVAARKIKLKKASREASGSRTDQTTIVMWTCRVRRESKGAPLPCETKSCSKSYISKGSTMVASSCCMIKLSQTCAFTMEGQRQPSYYLTKSVN